MKINEKNLCVYATSPPFDCDGFLNKKGEVNKAFQRRYFVLKGNLLFYFEKKGDKEPLGLIIVEGCTIELSEESDQYCFEIAFNGNRTYVLSAESQESMEHWMKALTSAGYEYKKLMIAELQRQLDEIEDSRNKMMTEASSSVAAIPRPPPRRQNPFNRPAPPVPPSNGNGKLAAAAQQQQPTLPFINGHFGSTSLRTASYQIACDTSPLPPPRGILPSASTGLIANTNAKSEFYLENARSQSQAADAISAKPTQHAAAAISTATVFPSTGPTSQSASSVDFYQQYGKGFVQLHEKFRKLILKDVLEYRAQQKMHNQPLIEL